jgi:hypothetical protein
MLCVAREAVLWVCDCCVCMCLCVLLQDGVVTGAAAREGSDVWLCMFLVAVCGQEEP